MKLSNISQRLSICHRLNSSRVICNETFSCGENRTYEIEVLFDRSDTNEWSSEDHRKATAHGERYGGRNSVGNGTKRLQNGSIHAVFPLFCRRNPSSLITGRFFLENDGRWPAEKRRVIRDDGLRRVIITVFTVSWSVSIVSDAVFLDLGGNIQSILPAQC